MSLPAKLLIVSSTNSGLASILCGYLDFYCGMSVSIAFKGEKEVIHPLAQQVMVEDGIHYWTMADFEPEILYDYILFINSESSDPVQAIATTRNLLFQDPLIHSGYDEILNSFRSVREDIKRKSIEFAGELLLKAWFIIFEFTLRWFIQLINRELYTPYYL